MSERSYTVREIDALRQVCDHKWVWGTYRHYQTGGPSHSRLFRPEERAGAVEELVRTHMFAGHTAEDLLASEEPKP